MADIRPETAPAALSGGTEALLRGAPDVFDADWYRARYPDVALSGLDPWRHYARYGMAIGRDPGPDFDVAFYLQNAPDVREGNIPAVVHYIRHGRAEGRPPTIRVRNAGQTTERIARLRDCLWGQGIVEASRAALQELADVPDPSRARALADWELAIAALRFGDPAAALNRIARARLTLAASQTVAGDLDRLDVLEQMAFAAAGNRVAARMAQARQGDRGAVPGPDAALAQAWADPDPAARLARLNGVWSGAGLTGAALSPGGGPAFDRLEGTAKRAAAGQGPRVTVLVAAYDAAPTLATALRSLLAQSWTELEILVIDDASDDGGATLAVARDFAARDPRVRVIAQAVNAGAYVARNKGLNRATGTYVTLMDADDWAHPSRIETQVRYLEAHPETVACTTPQARARGDLSFLRWTGRGDIVTPCTASLMVRRVPLVERLGAWDRVRVSADRELIRRLRVVFGPGAVADLPGAPLTLQRDHAASAVRDPILGILGEVSGARRAYRDAQMFHHARAGAEGLRYDASGPRAFPAPGPMLPDREDRIALDLVIGGDLRRPGPALAAALAACAAGPSPIGLLMLRDFDPACPDHPDAALQTHIHAGRARYLVPGDTVDCGRLLLPDPGCLSLRHRHLPRLFVDRVEGPDGAIPGERTAHLRARAQGPA